jgi:hypothetical protein
VILVNFLLKALWTKEVHRRRIVSDYGGPAFAREEPGLVGTVAREHHVGSLLALVPGARDRNHGTEHLLEELLRGFAIVPFSLFSLPLRQGTLAESGNVPALIERRTTPNSGRWLDGRSRCMRER